MEKSGFKDVSPRTSGEVCGSLYRAVKELLHAHRGAYVSAAHTSVCVYQKAHLTPFCYSPITSSMGQQNTSLSDLEYGLAIGLDGCQKMFLSFFTHHRPGRPSGRLDEERRPDGPHPLRRPGGTPITSRLSFALICWGDFRAGAT